MIHHPQLVRPPLVTYSWLCRTCVTYRMPCYARGHLPSHDGTSHLPFTASTTDWRECFFTLRRFLPYTPSCCFQSLSGASSSTSKIAGLHDDYWNIALARLLHWITAIHKRGILVGSIYVPNSSFEVRVPQSGNLPLTGFEPAFLKIPWVSSHLSWQFSHRFSWVLINK